METLLISHSLTKHRMQQRHDLSVGQAAHTHHRGLDYLPSAVYRLSSLAHWSRGNYRQEKQPPSARPGIASPRPSSILAAASRCNHQRQQQGDWPRPQLSPRKSNNGRPEVSIAWTRAVGCLSLLSQHLRAVVRVWLAFGYLASACSRRPCGCACACACKMELAHRLAARAPYSVLQSVPRCVP